MTGCDHSFDGLPACEIRGTTFFSNACAKKGGAVIVASGDDEDERSEVEFHECIISNNTAGREDLLDDPQGEGGAIVVGRRSFVLVADCLAEKNWAGKKVTNVVEGSSLKLYFRIGLPGKAWCGSGGRRWTCDCTFLLF